MMKRLAVSPLPCADVPDEARSRVGLPDGFVDESVVVSLLTAAHGERAPSLPTGPARVASALDYAGWALADSAWAISARAV